MTAPIVNFDHAHGGLPEHADMVVPTDFGSHKIRVDGEGNILNTDLVFSKQFMRELGINKSKTFRSP